jgi:protein phosphatase
MPTDMATTIVVAVLADRALHIANVGDSRAYLLDKEGIRQITEDHTLMAELIRMNRIDPEKARTHHMRHIITRVVGKEKQIEPAAQTLSVSPGDVILLCSDGLTDMLEDAQIEKILRSRKNPAAQAGALVESALQAGGRDNVTVVLAHVPANPVAMEVPVLSICHTGQFRSYTNKG